MVEPSQLESQVANPAVRHERSDVNVRAIVGFALVMIVLGVVIHLALWWLFQADMKYEADMKRSAFPLARDQQRHLPPEPRLERINRVEQNKGSEVEEGRLEKEAILNSYDRTQEKGFVRIPISRAMTLLDNKLPARPLPPSRKEKP